MKVAVIFDSKTGNTMRLADAIRDELDKEGIEVVYKGEPTEKIDADIYFVGSWTDKGICSEPIAEFLMNMRNKRIAYFGTAGFGVSEDYFKNIYDKACDMVDSSNELLGYFMCQGRMPMSVRERYERLKAETGNPRMDALIENFDTALTHPDNIDIANVKNWAKSIVKTNN